MTASGFVYLGAAAVRRRAAAWPMFMISFVLVSIGFVVTGSAPTWWMLGLGAALVVFGLVRGGLRPPWGLPLQTGAMIVLASTAVLGAVLAGPWAGVLVSAALLGHAGWDVYHRRSDRVVARSMTEFCGVLDTVLAAVVLVSTLSSAA